jgi:gliding motility-associated-like protein
MYAYRIHAIDQCANRLQSDSINSIKLSKLRESSDSLILHWNRYRKGGHQYSYHLEQSVDQSAYKTIVTTQDTFFIFKEMKSGFNFCFRVKAVNRNQTSDLSYSNIYCQNYEHKLKIPSVFTPNGDEINDCFEILNLQLYPKSSLSVVNKWGKEVYRSVDYQNNWKANDVEDGIYFYALKNENHSLELKGWVHVIR